MLTFNDEQRAALAAPLDRKAVAQREQAGRKFSYIEGWHAIAEANRIFGFDGWSRETVEIVQLGEPRQTGDKWRVEYRARVRIDVGGLVRDGCGFGQGIDKDVGQAHESALKEAETDAMKRALMTFGNPFGLALYDKSHANVATTPAKPVLISDDQRDELMQLAQAANVLPLVICESYNVADFREMTPEQYQKARKRLNLSIDQAITQKEAA